jgi:hypothetical protein
VDEKLLSLVDNGIPVNLGKNRLGRVRVVQAPRGSRIAYDTERHGKRLCYVLMPGSTEVIALTADGRVHLGDALQALVVQEMFGVDMVNTA